MATLERKVPAGDSWLFEMKFDGYRMQAAIAGDQVRLYSRNGHDWSRQFGYVAPALAELTTGTALIDRELCAIDEHGRSNFTLLKNAPDTSVPSTGLVHGVGNGRLSAGPGGRQLFDLCRQKRSVRKRPLLRLG
jgi:ATP-dependent DNA ligase